MQLLFKLFESFHEKYPLVTFDMYSATADHVKEQMDRGLVDIGLLPKPIDIEKYDFIRLDMKERWVVVMRPDCPLAKKETRYRKGLVRAPAYYAAASVPAWKRGQSFSLAATKFIEHIKCFLGIGKA